MFRWLLLGLLLAGLGVGVNNGWLVLNWDLMSKDLHLPNSNWTEDIYKTPDQTKEDPASQPQAPTYKALSDLIKFK
ncbi:MAG: 4-hydroxythreonine-4-phosphate dehydrogenase [Synechococcaceae cyanobacterium ELA445]